MKEKTKSIIALMVALFAVLIIGATTKVNAVEVTDTNINEQKAQEALDKLNLSKNNNGEYVFVKYYELGTNANYDTAVKELEKYFNEQGYEFVSTPNGSGGGGDLIFTIIGEGTYNIMKDNICCLEVPLQIQVKTQLTIPNGKNNIDYITTKINEYKSNLSITEVKKIEKVENNIYKIFYNSDIFGEGNGEILIKEEKPSTPTEPTPPATEPVTKEDTETGVKLETTTGTLTKDVVLTSTIIREVTNPVTKDTIRNISQKTTVYDINLLKDNAKVQPNGKVKISLPIPEGYNKAKLEIYRVDENGEKTKYDVKVEGNYATFETDHFSIYVLADVTKNDTSNNNQGTTNNTQPPKTNNDRELDETPKTGTIDTVKYILPVMIISAVVIIALRKKNK